MAVFKCKMCGGTLAINENQTTAVCEYCGTQQTLPNLTDDRRANLYDRANHFRRNDEFDKAAGIYERILTDDNTDAEAYWSLVLCRYGIEYVEDPQSHKRVPTINRTQYTSIFDDDNYKSALQYADSAQKAIYEAEAKAINEIQKGILEISQKEEPFDVFICYKETDNNGRRTQDSVLANDLYHQLTNEGFKVFFSRITLEDQLGTAYEPYIFAALNSAKVMVVLGTKPEYFNAVWVKNEWSRYLALIKNGAQKVLIPAYRDMDPYDLPEEFSHLQAQDMSKLGFMQDLIRGIKKLADAPEQKTAVKETTVVNTSGGEVAPLLKRAFMFLEDGDWESADEYCERVLDLDPENARAYLGKLMAELRCNTTNDFVSCSEPFESNGNYQKAIRFADDEFKIELNHYRLIGFYYSAVEKIKRAVSEVDFKEAAEEFAKAENYQDAVSKRQESIEKAVTICNDKIADFEAQISDLNNAVADFEKQMNQLNQIINNKQEELKNVSDLSIAEEKERDLLREEISRINAEREKYCGFFHKRKYNELTLQMEAYGEKQSLISISISNKKQQKEAEIESINRIIHNTERENQQVLGSIQIAKCKIAALQKNQQELREYQSMLRKQM